METITQSQFLDLLLHLKGATPVTISSLTSVKSRYGKPLYKLARVNGLAGADYSAAVNRLIPFVPKPRQWGRHISAAVIENEGAEGVKHYLQLKIERALSSIYLARHGSLFKVVREKELEGMLPKRDERPVTVRDYSLGSIQRISFGRKKYRILPDSSLGTTPQNLPSQSTLNDYS